MLLDLARYPFAAYAIGGAPDDPGVYILWEGDELTYIGVATGSGATIKSCLLEKLEKRERCNCSPTHYSWRLGVNLRLLERELLEKYERHTRGLPRCNKRHA
jgi:hypothetical protein